MSTPIRRGKVEGQSNRDWSKGRIWWWRGGLPRNFGFVRRGENSIGQIWQWICRCDNTKDKWLDFFFKKSFYPTAGLGKRWTMTSFCKIRPRALIKSLSLLAMNPPSSRWIIGSLCCPKRARVLMIIVISLNFQDWAGPSGVLKKNPWRMLGLCNYSQMTKFGQAQFRFFKKPTHSNYSKIPDLG